MTVFSRLSSLNRSSFRHILYHFNWCSVLQTLQLTILPLYGLFTEKKKNHFSHASHTITLPSRPAGKITVYLGRRDFVDNTSTTEPVDGVVVCDNDYLRGRKVFATVSTSPPLLLLPCSYFFPRVSWALCCASLSYGELVLLNHNCTCTRKLVLVLSH